MSHESIKLQELHRIRGLLSAHLTAFDDPCEDQGVEWPCDVARALLTAEERNDERRQSLERTSLSRSVGR